MSTIVPHCHTGLQLTRKDEGRQLRLLEDFGVTTIQYKDCPCCGQSTKHITESFEGFYRGAVVTVVRVESHTDSVYAMGRYEGSAHVTTVELQDGKTNELLVFAGEGLRIPGEWV